LSQSFDKLADDFALISASRVISMFIGLLMVPLLLHFLGGEGFAAWAIFWGISVVFAALQAGMPGAVVRFSAIAISGRDQSSLNRIVNNSLLLAGGIYIAGFIPIWGGI